MNYFVDEDSDRVSMTKLIDESEWEHATITDDNKITKLPNSNHAAIYQPSLWLLVLLFIFIFIIA